MFLQHIYTFNIIYDGAVVLSACSRARWRVWNLVSVCASYALTPRHVVAAAAADAAFGLWSR